MVKYKLVLIQWNTIIPLKSKLSRKIFNGIKTWNNERYVLYNPFQFKRSLDMYSVKTLKF